MQDKQIAHQQAFIRYSNGKADTIKPFLLDIVDYIDARLAKEGETIRSKARLKVLQDDVNNRLNSIYNGWVREDQKPMYLETADLELDFQDSLHAQVETIRPTDDQALAAAKSNPLIIGSKGGAVDFTVYTKAWKPQEIKRVQDIISGGFYTGQTNQQIARTINGTKSAKYADGVLNLSRANIQSMVRTSLNHISTQAKGVYGKENKDIIIGERIVATLDINTTPECRDRDGDVVLYADNPNPPRPPFHYGCRSTFVYVYDPKFDFLDKGATRASRGAEGGQQVPEKQTYYTWLKNQPAMFQDEALGKEKGKIFRNAGLSPDEFKKAATNRFKQAITIDEMKEKDRRIADYLNK